MIAPGNHWIMDSLRGAPPPGEAFGVLPHQRFLGKMERERLSPFPVFFAYLNQRSGMPLLVYEHLQLQILLDLLQSPSHQQRKDGCQDENQGG